MPVYLPCGDDLGAQVILSSEYPTIDDAFTAANAAAAGGTSVLLWVLPGIYNAAAHITVNQGVSWFMYGATIRWTIAGGGIHVPAPIDSSFLGGTFHGNDTAVGSDASGAGTDALFKIGTESGGDGSKSVFRDIRVRSVGAGGWGIANHGIQNSQFSNVRVNDSALALGGWLVDNGSKNCFYEDCWPTNSGTYGVLLTTSDVGLAPSGQRTSKQTWRGGLTELTTNAFRIEDAEQTHIRDLAMNGESAGIGVYCVAGGNRGGSAHGPDDVLLDGVQIKDFTTAIQTDVNVVILVGDLSISGATTQYQVNNNNARIHEVAPHASESGTRFASSSGAVEQTSVIRTHGIDTVPLSASTVTWTNMPAALTEFNGARSTRVWVDASQYRWARITAQVNVAGAAGSKLRLYYKTSDGAFNTFSTAGTSDIEVAVSAIGLVKSSWIPLAAAARADVIFAIGGITGDGAADPEFGAISVQYA